MTDQQGDDVNTDEIDGTIVPLETIRSFYGVSRDTIERWVKADNITLVDLPSESGIGREKGIRWEHVTGLPAHPKRWRARTKVRHVP